MSRSIILSPDARADFDAAARWYRRKDINLSRRFISEVDSTLLRIARHPHAFVRVYAGVRRATMNRFRYNIQFRFSSDTVVVIAISHQRMSDAIWKDRVHQWQETGDD